MPALSLTRSDPSCDYCPGCAAIGLLRDLADTLEALPRAQRADALRLLVPTLTEVDRVATILGLWK